jgi:hypothetical protein
MATLATPGSGPRTAVKTGRSSCPAGHACLALMRAAVAWVLQRAMDALVCGRLQETAILGMHCWQG